MRAMDNAVENRIGQRGVAHVLVPAIDRQLTRDDGRSVAVTVVEDLEQILALRVFEPDEAPIIKDQDVDAREAGQHRRVRAVTVRQRELGKQARKAAVDHAMMLAAGLLASINWLVAQTGTVSPDQQRRELFGGEAQQAQQAQQGGDRSPGEPELEPKAKEQ